MTAAPQCPYPDANLGRCVDLCVSRLVTDRLSVSSTPNHSMPSTCNIVSSFFYLYWVDVQISVIDNNQGCDYQSYPAGWNFGTWDNWAKTVSPNKNVKVYVGVPGAAYAAPSGGYMDPSQLQPVIDSTMSQYSSFGGVMIWDASVAYGMLFST